MSKFVIKNRPKKPAEPQYVNYNVGNYVTVGYVLECIEKFKAENPDLTTRELTLEARDDDYLGSHMFLTAPPQSHKNYEIKMETYKTELRAYKAWQGQYKTQIEKHKAAEKKATAKRKLLRRMESLTKELEGVESKLAKT